MTSTTANILNIFQEFRMAPTPIDQFEQTGKQILGDKIDRFVSQNKPIEFSMLGFPMKSSNDRDKVLGKLPDYAEEVAIANFGTFNDKVSKVYQHGIKMTIVSDGFVFNDLISIDDKTVSSYEEATKDLARNVPMELLKLHDFYGGKSLDTMRTDLMSQFGITEVELERRIMMDPDVNFLYRGMIRFMNEELANRNYPSGNQLQKAAKKLARDMMFRNEAYSRLVQTELSDHIRLSMHPSINNGTKYSFQLIPSPKAWTSPWHCAVAVGADGVLETVHRKDAEKQGYRLVSQHGRPYYYEA